MRIMVVAAHFDDEVLGCGGMMARAAARGGEVLPVICCWKRLTARPVAQVEQDEYRDMANEAAQQLGVLAPVFLSREPTMFLDEEIGTQQWALIKELESYGRRWSPDVVFTHGAHDINQDHRAVWEASRVAFRPGVSSVTALLTYEVVSTTVSSEFRPNYYVGFDRDVLNKKLSAWTEYSAEWRVAPSGRNADGLKALATVRGGECGAHYAEAFNLVFWRD